MFSPTVDTDSKVVLGGSLTNWPASRDKKGNVLLRPIDLEFGLRGWELSNNLPADGNVAQVEVQVNQSNTAGTTPQTVTYTMEENLMALEMTKEELTDLIGQAVKAQIGEMVQTQVQGTPKPEGEGDPKTENFDWLAFLNMKDVNDQAVQAAKEQMLAAYDQMQKRAAQEAAQMIARIKRESTIKEEAQLMVGGRKDAPVGIPSTAEGLEKFMSGLDDGQLKFFTDLMANVQSRGLVSFEESGHGRQPQGTAPLPEYYAAKLDKGELTLTELSNPILAPDLGDLKRYDLSKWQK